MKLTRLLAAAGLAVLATTPRMAQAQTQTIPDSLMKIVWAHAPIILHETNGYSNEAAFNHLLKVDFDFDWNMANNWASADNFPSVPGNRRPTVYYSIVSTQAAYYIGYYFYHPKDTGIRLWCINWPWPFPETCASLTEGHQNDLEGYWVMVERNWTPDGTAKLAWTIAHGALFPNHDYLYWGNTTGPTVQYEAGGSGASNRPIYHWWDNTASRYRPVLMVREGMHGVWRAPSIPEATDSCSGQICGIYPQGDGSRNYASIRHGNTLMIKYWPQPVWDCQKYTSCSVLQVPVLPLNYAEGDSHYLLESILDGPFWKARGNDYQMYTSSTNQPAQQLYKPASGDANTIPAYPCLRMSDTADCGAQAPWAWAGGGNGHCEDLLLGMNACYLNFGMDKTESSYSSYIRFKAIGYGTLLTHPARGALLTWGSYVGNEAWEPSYGFNPYAMVDPVYEPPLSAGINGPDSFDPQNTYGSFSLVVSGGSPPYTIVRSTDVYGAATVSNTFGLDIYQDQYLYVDVTDSQGHVVSLTKFLDYCGSCGPGGESRKIRRLPPSKSGTPPAPPRAKATGGVLKPEN